MPDYNYPPLPTDTGAITIPRMLNRWLDVSYQQGPLRRCQTFITLPSFVTTEQFSSVSDIVASFNFEAPNNFVLTSVLFPPISSNYTLCISFRIGTVLTRYVLWQAAGTVFGGFPPYNGQTILKNFRLEVWNTSQGPAVETVGATFYTSVLQPVDYRWGADAALSKNDGQQTAFTISESPISSIASVDYFWDSATNVTGNVTSWGSLVGAISINSNGLMSKIANDPLLPFDTQTLSCNGNNDMAQGNFASKSIKFMTMVVNIQSTFAGVFQILLSNGNYLYLGGEFGGNLQINNSPLVTLNTGQFYIVNVNFVTGIMSVYTLQGLFVTSATAGTIASNNCTNVQFISQIETPISLASFGISTNIPTLSQILAYYGTKYVGAFALPMTFPNGSVSTTN